MAEQIIPKNQTLNIVKYDYRIIYAKQGRAKYISHLDLMRTMQRIFKRCKLPVWFTQGFNPHAYIMFPLALPLGTDSDCEIMEIALTEKLDFDEVKQRINSVMPEGMKVLSVYEPQMKHTEISGAEYIVKIKPFNDVECLKKSFQDFLNSDSIVIDKRTKKKGINKVNIKPYIEVVSLCITDNMLELCLKLPCGNEFTLNPQTVVEAFLSLCDIKADEIWTYRTKIFCSRGELFH